MSDLWEKLFDDARRENGLGNTARADELVSLAIQKAEELAPDSRSYSKAQCSFALWRHFQDRFAEAELFQNRYIEAERRLGTGDRELANTMMWLAEMQQKQGKLDIAKETIESAIKTYPPGYFPELSNAYNDLASVLDAMGRLAEASSARMKSADLAKEWENIVESRITARGRG